MVNKKKKEFKGINKVNIKFYKKQNKTIRTLSQINYRLLSNQNYLLKNSGNLSSNSFKLKECWNLLKYELGKKGINQIKIYLNMICQKVKELIRKKKMF